MQTNHKEVVTKETLVTVERIGPRTSVTKRPVISKATGEIAGTSQKIQNSPSAKRRRGQELNANVNGLANLETLQVGNFESHVENIKDSVL